MTKIVNGCEVPEEFKTDDEQVKDVLEQFENDTINDVGIRQISSGFAKAEITDYDNEYFYVTLKYGVVSDCNNSVTVEDYKLNRLTLSIED